jgi:hypothetical protein
MGEKCELTVRSTVIYWQEGEVEITDTGGTKHTVPLDKRIHVVMVGYPDREEKDLLARELEPYMLRGYIIEKISYEA